MPKYESVNWDLAECAGLYTDLFYDIEEERSAKAYQYINAVRSVCARCPLWQSCLAYAFQNEKYGVWGGMTSLERASIEEPEKYPVQRRRALFDLMEHGITLHQITQVLVLSKEGSDDLDQVCL